MGNQSWAQRPVYHLAAEEVNSSKHPCVPTVPTHLAAELTGPSCRLAGPTHLAAELALVACLWQLAPFGPSVVSSEPLEVGASAAELSLLAEPTSEDEYPCPSTDQALANYQLWGAGFCRSLLRSAWLGAVKTEGTTSGFGEGRSFWIFSEEGGGQFMGDECQPVRATHGSCGSCL